MANQQGLEAAMTLLGYSFIEALSTNIPSEIVLAVHRSKKGIVTGVYGDKPALTGDAFDRAKVLFGTAQQPLPTFSASASSGVFVAESLFASMSSRLKAAKHNKLNGLAATLLPSSQLQLVP